MWGRHTGRDGCRCRVDIQVETVVDVGVGIQVETVVDVGVGIQVETVVDVG